jgi:hypothetical protein
MRAKDFPIDAVAAKAKQMHAAGWDVHQKWTCRHCGSRQTMETPNQFYRQGICEECKRTTQITECNYLCCTSGMAALLKERA